MEQIKWWGYKHVNGSLQVKRYFDERDLKDAWESDFVISTYGPIEANSRDEAMNRIKEMADM